MRNSIKITSEMVTPVTPEILQLPCMLHPIVPPYLIIVIEQFVINRMEEPMIVMAGEDGCKN